MTQKTTLHFPPTAQRSLAMLRSKTRIDSNVGIIRASLQILNELVDITARGGSIVVCDKRGRDWPQTPPNRIACPSPALDRYVAITEKNKAAAQYTFTPDIMLLFENIAARTYLTKKADIIMAALEVHEGLLDVVRARECVIVTCSGREFVYFPHEPFDTQALGTPPMPVRPTDGADSPRNEASNLVP